MSVGNANGGDQEKVGEAERQEAESTDSTPRGRLRLTLSRESKKTIVDVFAIDAPGPSGYSKMNLEMRNIGVSELLPEIDSAVLADKDTLLRFLGRFFGAESPVRVTCLVPRLDSVRELLGAPPTASEISVALPSQ